MGLAWEPEEFIVELQTRLLMPIFGADGYCTACDAVMDTKGHHARMCACLGDRVARHNSARNAVYRSAAAAGCCPDLERSGLLPPRPDDPAGNANLRRPADVYIPTWEGGSPAAFDLAITSPQRIEVVATAARTAGAAAVQYEETKRTFLNTAEICATQGIQFLPLVAETSGGWGPTGLKTISKLAKRTALVSEQSASVVFSQLLESLCVAIRRANARAVLERSQGHMAEISPILLSAADAIAA